MRRLLASAILLCACSGGDEALVVGTEPEFPPFEERLPDGSIAGFDIDLVRMLAEELGRPLRIEAMDFPSLIPELRTGKVDLIASGMTANPERAQEVAFSEPYFHTHLCLLVNVRSRIDEPEDADGKRLVVKEGTTGAQNAPTLFPRSTITTLPTEGACAMEVVSGNADAFLYDRHSVWRHHQEHPGTTRILWDSLSSEPYALAVRLEDRELLDRVNAFLAKIREDGRLKALRDKHFSHLPDEAR